MRSALILPRVGLALIVASCGGASDAATGWLAGDGKPVDLALTFDPANGEAKIITPKGGSIGTSGEDGTLYQLHIPEGALLSDVRISIIPVASVKKLPLEGGSVAAVHLKPDGLRLLKPATLRIRARTEVPVAEQVAFAYLGNGKDAHLYPLTRDRTRIELPILHFSGYGFGRAAPNDPGRIALQHAVDKEARLASKLAEAINRERAKPEGEGSAEMEILVKHLAQYYKEVVRPLMKIAETDERMAECAIQRALAWERYLQILGIADDDSDVVGAVIGSAGSDAAARPPRPGSSEIDQLRQELAISGRKVAENARRKLLERVVKRCREKHDFYAVTELLALQRQAHLVGCSISDEPGADVEAAMDAIKDCMTFEVEFHSLIETKTPSGGSYYQLRGRASLSIDVLTPSVRVCEPTLGRSSATALASAPLNYVSFSASGNPKEDLFGKGTGDKIGNALLEVLANGTISGVGTRPGTLTVHSVAWRTSLQDMQQTNCEGKDETQRRQVADSFTVTLSFGTPTELVRFTPKHMGEQSTMEQEGWLQAWHMRHREGMTVSPQADDQYHFDLRPVEPGVWRVDFKESEPPMSGFSKSEATYVVLRHTPK